MMTEVPNCFRPLTGIKVSEPQGQAYLELSLYVSVPSRGLRCLNEKITDFNSYEAVSVPSRGLRCLNPIYCVEY